MLIQPRNLSPQDTLSGWLPTCLFDPICASDPNGRTGLTGADRTDIEPLHRLRMQEEAAFPGLLQPAGKEAEAAAVAQPVLPQLGPVSPVPAWRRS